METMTVLLNHIQGKIGSRWMDFLKQTGTENILILAIDAAKYSHHAMLCSFFGEIILNDFEFDASLSGIEEVKQIVERVKKEYKLSEVVVGVETTGHYYEDLVRHFKQCGYHIRIINSATTANERKTMLNSSKTDRLDLITIAQTVIHGRGNSGDLSSGRVRELKKLTRVRRELVKERTATKNNILGYVDYIFREFQGKVIWEDGVRKKKKPFFNLFSNASRYIMRHHLHSSDILALGPEGLRKLSVDKNLKLRDNTIHTLIKLAEASISLPKEALVTEQLLLNQKLDQYEFLEVKIRQLEEEIERLYIQTEGAILLSIPGVGLILGAELYAEMGDIRDFDQAAQLIKMAGTNPVVKQSGEGKGFYFAVSKQGRKAFRNAVYLVGRSVAINNPEMQARYLAMKDRGKYAGQAYIALGNRMIRLAFAMIKKQSLYNTDSPDYSLQKEIHRKLSPENAELFYEKFFKR